MLQLQKGRAMEYLTDSLERTGFRWAYRVIDARSFGLPQRRQRVLLLASRTDDPRCILFPDDSGVHARFEPVESACGFYWTEGSKGLGWAVDAVPTLKGGSTIGIPSPPAIWLRHTTGAIEQPEIRDAERLQGFPVDWTAPACSVPGVRAGARWKLVGNAVSVPMAQWLGECIGEPRPYDDRQDVELPRGAPWPKAAWGVRGERFAAGQSLWPVETDYRHLEPFLRFPTKPLSARASNGFLGRAYASTLRFPSGFLEAVQVHANRMSRTSSGAPRRPHPRAVGEDRA
jgi:DNA (cytosine-5)-methyltransferase 1